MALSSTEKAQARLYLGYPNIFRYENTRLESVLGDLDTDAENMVRAILVELTSVDAVLAAAGQVIAAQGTLKAVDEIEWYNLASGASNGSGALTRGRFLVNRLSIMFGCPIYSDFFGSYGYLGDTFSSGGVPGNGFMRNGAAYRLG